jgi:signal transduction histidine kinase
VWHERSQISLRVSPLVDDELLDNNHLAMREGTHSERRLRRLRELCERLAPILDASAASVVAVDALAPEVTNVAIYLFDGAIPRLTASRGELDIDPCAFALSTSHVENELVISPFAKVASHPHGLLVVRSGLPVDDGLRGFVELAGALIAASLLAASSRAEQAIAERANRAKDEFMAMLGHELRNPLAPIRTALELMRLRGTAGLERERAVIERQTDHLASLVEDLLDVSRITRGMVQLRRERLRLSRIIARAAETAAPLFEQQRHQLTCNIADDIIIDGDEGRMTQVFSNLLNNAAKYTGPGGRIGITATLVDGDVVVAVKDSGRGMSAEMLPRVFELFTQERQNIDRSQGGLGLGLAIVKSLIELHGGQVGALSAGLDQGSTFWVRMPFIPEQSLDEGVIADGSQRATGGGATVLIVDDNVDAALMLSDLLSGIGYATRVAHDAPQALAMADEYVPDVALLDIGLPAMDGYELARRLREKPAWCEVRLIAVTGYGQSSDRKRSLEAGFDHHLVKPIGLAALQQVIPRDEW